MKSIRRLSFIAFALGCLLPAAAGAQRQWIQGRTGLPTVRDGDGQVWMQQGRVQMRVIGDDVMTIQDYRLQLPRPPLERDPVRITVVVREDYFRGHNGGQPDLRLAEARGFERFTVTIDGRAVSTRTLPWELNDKRDTATRWREWTIAFRPGQTHRMQIISRAPLGQQGRKPWLNFVSKDLGHWRDVPDMLEIKLFAPGSVEARMTGLEPAPENINAGGIRWIYRKASPNRDIYALFPMNFNAHRSVR